MTIRTTANIFNAYFVNSANNKHVHISTIKHHALNYLYKIYAKPFPQIKLTPASTKEICEIIISLKWKNLSGYDEIPVSILKLSLPYISTHTYM